MTAWTRGSRISAARRPMQIDGSNMCKKRQTVISWQILRSVYWESDL